MDHGKKEIEAEKVKINRRNFIIGLSLIGFSFSVYLVIPVIFCLNISMKAKSGSAAVSYILSWVVLGIGICFAGKEGYEFFKEIILKGFFRKIIGKKKDG